MKMKKTIISVLLTTAFFCATANAQPLTQDNVIGKHLLTLSGANWDIFEQGVKKEPWEKSRVLGLSVYTFCEEVTDSAGEIVFTRYGGKVTGVKGISNVSVGFEANGEIFVRSSWQQSAPKEMWVVLSHKLRTVEKTTTLANGVKEIAQITSGLVIDGVIYYPDFTQDWVNGAVTDVTRTGDVGSISDVEKEKMCEL